MTQPYAPNPGMQAPPRMGKFEPRRYQPADKVQAQTLVDRLLLVQVHERLTKDQTKHSNGQSRDGITVDVWDLNANAVYCGPLWMGGGVVDPLTRYAGTGEIVAIYLRWHAPSKPGGYNYIAVEEPSEADQATAEAWFASNPQVFNNTRAERGYGPYELQNADLPINQAGGVVNNSVPPAPPAPPAPPQAPAAPPAPPQAPAAPVAPPQAPAAPPQAPAAPPAPPQAPAAPPAAPPAPPQAPAPAAPAAPPPPPAAPVAPPAAPVAPPAAPVAPPQAPAAPPAAPAPAAATSDDVPF